MGPFVANGDLWAVTRVPEGDPRLVDRTGRPRLATTDPSTRTVSVRSDVVPPLLDQVVLHEVAHALTISWGLLPALRAIIPPWAWVAAEEWAAGLVERHAIEAVTAAAQVLGRPVCVRGECMGQSRSE